MQIYQWSWGKSKDGAGERPQQAFGPLAGKTRAARQRANQSPPSLYVVLRHLQRPQQRRVEQHLDGKFWGGFVSVGLSTERFLFTARHGSPPPNPPPTPPPNPLSLALGKRGRAPVAAPSPPQFQPAPRGLIGGAHARWNVSFSGPPSRGGVRPGWGPRRQTGWLTRGWKGHRRGPARVEGPPASSLPGVNVTVPLLLLPPLAPPPAPVPPQRGEAPHLEFDVVGGLQRGRRRRLALRAKHGVLPVPPSGDHVQGAGLLGGGWGGHGLGLLPFLGRETRGGIQVCKGLRGGEVRGLLAPKSDPEHHRPEPIPSLQSPASNPQTPHLNG